MRTFVALELDDAVRARLAAARDRLAAAGADVRLVDPALYHLTVKFLGEIDEADAGRAGAILEAACAEAPPFDLGLAGVGLFPSSKRPRVVAARIPEVPGTLAALAATLDGAFADLGVAADGRAFTPHLTLGRLKSKRGLDALVLALGELAGTDFGTVHVDHLTLMHSVLGREGPSYTALLRAPLRPA